MKTKAKWLAAAAVLAVMAAGRAEAANPSYLYIDVTISNNLSVAVAGAAASTVAATYTGSATPMGPVGVGPIVSNDSGYIAERWELKTSQYSADSTNGNTGWTIGGAAGSETAELQALFVSAAYNCPSLSALEWSNATQTPALLYSAQAWYTSTTLVDSSATSYPDVSATSRMNPGSTRGLCWKLTGPTSTALTDVQVVPVVVTAF